MFDESPRDARLSADDRPAPAEERPARGQQTARADAARRAHASARLARGKRALIGRLAYWSLVVWPVACDRRRRRRGLGRRASAADPVAGNSQAPAVDPDRRRQGRALARRGDLAGAPMPVEGNAALRAEGLRRHRGSALLRALRRRSVRHRPRASIANILHRGVAQGGSTITQQLAKNLFLTQERTITRKLQEALLALWLERKFSKTQILELYLNRVYFGSGAYGIEQASQRYFGKSARQITLAEAALLAGLVKSPSRLAPTRNFDGAEKRAKVVLAAMAELRFIKPDEPKHRARASAAHRARRPATARSTTSPIGSWTRSTTSLGHVDEDIVVQTTIDASLQASAEKSLDDELAQKGDKNGVGQGALVAMTPDGAVRAMVGGRNYAESQFNRAVAAKRQPGSAFKPFVYLTALEHGLTPDTVREDKPIKVKGWQPENYGHEYFGPVTLTKALALSLNTVSVRLTLEFTPMAVDPHRVPARHRLEARAQRLDRARHLGSLDARTGRRLCAVRQWRLCAVMPHVIEKHHRRATARCFTARNAQPLGRIIEARYVAMMNAMMARDADHRHRAQGGVAGLAGGRQDRHVAGFPRRLVHRLHRAPRHRRLARQ